MEKLCNIKYNWLEDDTRCPVCGSNNIVHQKLEFDTPTLCEESSIMYDINDCRSCGARWTLEFSIQFKDFKIRKD